MARRAFHFANQESRSFLATLLLIGFFIFFGGASRADTLAVVIVRPVAALALAYAVLRYAAAGPRGFKVPVSALAGLAVLCILQLIPLPPGLWSALSGREAIVQGFTAAGLDLPWAPLSVVPMATLNSLGAMIVPLTALLLFASLEEEGRRRLFLVSVAFALFSATWGFAQLIGGERGFLYPYQISNVGSPIGLFANRNHQAVLLAATIPVLFALAASRITYGGPRYLAWVSRGVAVGMVIVAVTTGSRTGTILAFGTMTVSMIVLDRPVVQPARRGSHSRARRYLRFAMPVALAALLALAFALTEGAAFTRFAEKDGFDDIRFQILPEVIAMAKAGLPFGWGFGSFPEVYQVYERTEMIVPSYINRAHNDWLELVVEGGIPALAIYVSLALWVAARIWRRWHDLLNPRDSLSRMQCASAIGIAVLWLASLFDYPLRTPALATLAALFIGQLAVRRSGPTGEDA